MSWLSKLLNWNRRGINTHVKPTQSEKTTVYFTLELPDKITGIVRRSSDERGSQNTEFCLYHGADPLTLIELKAAVYWNDSMDEGLVLKNDASKWLEATQAVTGGIYFIESLRVQDPEKSALLSCLAKLSVHYAILEQDSSPQGQAVSEWLKSLKEGQAQNHRIKDLVASQKLAEPLRTGSLNPDLVGHLKRSVSPSSTE